MKRFSIRRLFAGNNEPEQRLRQFSGVMEQAALEKTVLINQPKENYFSLINTVDGIVWEADAASFRFTFVSKKAEQLLGYPLDQWMEEGFWVSHLHPEDREFAINFCQQSTRDRKPHEFEYRMIAADERIIWLRDIVSLEIKEDKVLRLKGIMIDITHTKEAERTLRKSEERYRTLVENAPEALVVFDTNQGRFVNVSESAARLFKMSKEELMKIGPGELSPEFQPDGTLSEVAIRKNLADAVAGSKPVFEWMHKDAYGNPIPCEVWLVRLPSDEGVLIRGSIIDITERKKFEKQLQDSYREIRQLTEYLQNIREQERSHIAREIHDELGQQLTALKMDVSWLTNKVATDDEQVMLKLSNLAHMLDTTVKTVRRISSELRPSLLDDLGLVAAMDWHLHEFGRNFGLKTIFQEPGKDINLPEIVKTGLFRIFQESLTNVARHAEAKKVKVALEEFPRHLS